MINNKTVFTSAAGGVLDVISAEGELIYQFKVPAGRQRASQFLDLIPDGAKLEISEGLAGFQPRNGVAVNAHPEAYQTAANPDYVPLSNADKMAEKMRRDMARLAAAADTAERRAKALMKMERIPQAPKEAGLDVIVDTPAPAPEAKAE